MTTTVKSGDTRPVTWKINADLTGITSAEIHVAPYDATTPTALPCTITDAALGEVTWVPNGELAAGTYRLEVQLTGPGATITTVPTVGHAVLLVQDDIA